MIKNKKQRKIQMQLERESRKEKLFNRLSFLSHKELIGTDDSMIFMAIQECILSILPPGLIMILIFLSIMPLLECPPLILMLTRLKLELVIFSGSIKKFSMQSNHTLYYMLQT